MSRSEDNLAHWRDALQLLPLAEEGPAQRGTHLRVLFQPAFHDPGCLTLHLQAQASTVEFILPGPSVQAWVRQASDPRARSERVAPPDLYWVAAPVSIAALERFQAAVAGIALAALGDRRPSTGRDGMLIDGEVVEAGVGSTFAAWRSDRHRGACHLSSLPGDARPGPRLPTRCAQPDRARSYATLSALGLIAPHTCHISH